MRYTHLCDTVQKIVLVLYVFPERVLCLQLLLASVADNPKAIAGEAELTQLCVYLIVFAENARKTHCVDA